MENKKSAMANLLEEYGFCFETMDNEIQEEVKTEVVEEPTPIIEEKNDTPKDITIKCKKCENEFVWSVREQEFYKEKGFYKPSYCKECRKKTKLVNNFHKSN